MGQIVRRKKRGRPSKSDLAPARERDVRRSLRRRNVKYTIDYDDYLDDDSEYEFEDEEEEMRKAKKKLKLMAKLNPAADRVTHARHDSGSSSEDDDERDRKPLKKRPINGVVAKSEDDDDYEENDGGGGDDDDDDGDCEARKADSKHIGSSPPGTPSGHRSEIPLPDKKTLELILHKLQKKDTYGVYAEPVDPEELPDYHEVIEHPMDFATVRKKLADGAYSTLEQFESDIFLICSNAKQYNSPDTIYHKQACSIQELGRRKFEKVRLAYERSEKEVKSEQKTKSNSLFKKQIKKPLSRTLQEPLGSDFSAGATLATVIDVRSISHPIQGTGCERPSNIDGPVEGNSSLNLNEANQEKADEMLSGKSLLSKAGKKPLVFDENRRATYNLSSQPEIISESIFTTFEDEIKQLVAVGLHAEFSYARSLARFSGSLGPVAWKVASKRIEQALPDGCKFGRGWVEEYEPLPTPVLMVGSSAQNQSALAANFFSHFESETDDRNLRTSIPAKDRSVTRPATEETQLNRSITRHVMEERQLNRSVTRPVTEERQLIHSVTRPVTEERQHCVSVPTSVGRPSVTRPVTEERPHTGERPLYFGSPRGHYSEERLSALGSVGAKFGTTANPIHQQQHPQSRFIEPEKQVPRKVELNSAHSVSQSNAKIVAEKQARNSETAAPRSSGTVLRNMNLLQPVPFKMPDSNGVVTSHLPNGKGMSACLENRMIGSSDNAPRHVGSNGKGMSACLENRMIGSSDNAPRQVGRTAAYFPHAHEQGLSDPVQLMKKLAENQKQQRPSNQSSVDTKPIVSSVPSMRRDDSSNAAAATARGWMSIGGGAFKQPTDTIAKSQIYADSLYNPARESHSQISRVRGEFPYSGVMQFQATENSFSFPTFLPRPVHMATEPQFQNRPIFFPQLAAADLSRFQVPPPWRGISPYAQPRQKQESLPPDLNIGFQSPGSPVKQSSGVQLDSQQPDLALQL